MVVAGDADLAGDNQEHQWVRNSAAHTPGPISTAAAALNADEPERSTTANTANMTNSRNELRSDIQAGAQLQRTIRMITRRS